MLFDKFDLGHALEGDGKAKAAALADLLEERKFLR